MCGTPLDIHPRRRFVDCILNSPTDVSKHYVSLSANGSSNVRPLQRVVPVDSGTLTFVASSSNLSVSHAGDDHGNCRCFAESLHVSSMQTHGALRTRSNDPFLLCRQRHQLPMLSRTFRHVSHLLKPTSHRSKPFHLVVESLLRSASRTSALGSSARARPSSLTSPSLASPFASLPTSCSSSMFSSENGTRSSIGGGTAVVINCLLFLKCCRMPSFENYGRPDVSNSCFVDGGSTTTSLGKCSVSSFISYYSRCSLPI